MSRSRFGATILTLSFAVLLVSMPALADTVTLNPTKDNTLYEPIAQDACADMSDGAGPTMFTGRTKDADADCGAGTRAAVRRGVLAFDVAGNVPTGSVINSAQLILYADKVRSNTNFNTSLHRLLSNWGEGTSNTGNSQQGRGEPPTTNDATWHHTFYSGLFWSVPGGDYSLTASAVRTVGPTGFYTWGSTSGMVADVQSWLGNPAQNYGWIIIGTESVVETSKRFATRENVNLTGGVPWKPRLVIDYTPQVISGGCCQGAVCTIETPAACLSLGGVYQGDGTSCSPNPCFVPTGACCAANGTCSEVTQSACTAAGGTYQGDGAACAGTYCPIVLTPYLDPLPIPPIATPTSGTIGGAATYTITMREFEQQLHSQLPPTRVWGYHDGVSGMWTPGPVIVARTGFPVTVNWVNDIRDFDTSELRRDDHYLDVDVQEDAEGMVCIHGAEDRAKTVVHLHGGHVPQSVDGYPEDTFLPGDPPVPYTYPNDQQAGYIWFHDHALGITRLNVYMGLAGAYILRDSVEDAINLPPEVPLVFQDKKLNPDGSLEYPSLWVDHFFGDKIMVNGKIWPYLDVQKGKYRFKLINGSTSRVYTLSLVPPSGALTFTVIGTDGGLLEAPARGVGTLTMGPGERYEVVVDFAAFNAADEILLHNSAAAPFPNGTVDVTQIMKFRVLNAAGDTDPIPDALRPIERIDPSEAVLTRDLRLKQSGTDGCGRSMWEINGLGWHDITEYPELGTTEIWRYINDSGVSHPMHMHLVMFQILDRDGFTKGPNGEIIPNGSPQAPPAEEDGWKDTAMVAPGEILRVIMRFEGYKGRYAYHCHILEHEEHEMMRQFQTVSCGDAELDPTEECDQGDTLPWDGCSAGCDREEYVQVSGTPQGGGAQMTVEGNTVNVPTAAGQTAADVAAALAAAINADPMMQALGITAQAFGGKLYVNGTINQISFGDPGLTSPFTVAVTPAQLWWTTVPAATGYDMVRGDLALLQSGLGDFTTATQECLANNSVPTVLAYPATPALGSGWWFVLRAATLSGPGTYDDGSAGQVGLRDAEIDASALACP